MDLRTKHSKQSGSGSRMKKLKQLFCKHLYYQPIARFEGVQLAYIECLHCGKRVNYRTVDQIIADYLKQNIKEIVES